MISHDYCNTVLDSDDRDTQILTATQFMTVILATHRLSDAKNRGMCHAIACLSSSSAASDDEQRRCQNCTSQPPNEPLSYANPHCIRQQHPTDPSISGQAQLASEEVSKEISKLC
jgi:hypothetical protein